MVSQEDIKIALDHLTEPLTGLPLLHSGLVKEVFVENNKVKIILQYPSPLYPYKEEVKKLIKDEIKSLDIFCQVVVEEAGREVLL